MPSARRRSEARRGRSPRRSGRRRDRAPDERRRRPPATRARNGANVSLVTSPAQTRSHRASRTVDSSAVRRSAETAASRSAQNDAPRSARWRRSTSWCAPSGGEPWAGTTSSGTWSRNTRRTRPSCAPSAPAPNHTTSPVEHRRSSSEGRRSGTLTPNTSASRVLATTGAPCSTATASASASGPRWVAPTPCQRGRNRPKAACDTGSTSRRRAARLRRRSIRSTSESHHSASMPPGVNSPPTTPPSASRPRSTSPTTATGRPVRRASCSRGERRVRAGEAPHEIAQRMLDGDGERRRQPDRDLHAEGVAEAAGVFGGDHPVLSAHRRLEGPPLLEELGHPAVRRRGMLHEDRSPVGAHLSRLRHRPRHQLGDRQRPQHPQQVVQLVGVARSPFGR